METPIELLRAIRAELLEWIDGDNQPWDTRFSDQISRIDAVLRTDTTATNILRRMIETSPFPDFEDATGNCYFCGLREHAPDCPYIQAEQVSAR